MPQSHLNLIKELVDHIETHLDEEINVVLLASSMGISPWHFQRLFKGLVGDSLGSYIRGRRLTKAAQLLKQDTKSIIDIALDVGFSSHEAFTRSFKTYFDHTPKDFRSLKPSVFLKDKPMLSNELLSFLAERIDTEPLITTLPKVRVIGYTMQIPSPFLDPIHCTTIAQPWIKLLEKSPHIKDLKSSRFYGITMSPSGQFTEEELTYMAAIEVDDSAKVTDDLVELILPEQYVAIFDVTTNVQDDNLKQKIDSIYGYWLLNSKYERGQGHDFELFQNMVDPMAGKFDASYVVPLRQQK